MTKDLLELQINKERKDLEFAIKEFKLAFETVPIVVNPDAFVYRVIIKALEIKRKIKPEDIDNLKVNDLELARLRVFKEDIQAMIAINKTPKKEEAKSKNNIIGFKKKE